MKKFIIGPSEEGIRLDKQLKKILNNAGSGFVYKMLRKKNITLNNRKAEGNEHLKKGDVIKIFLSDETFDKFSADSYQKIGSRGSLYGSDPDFCHRIIYEDSNILMYDKPVGILSQKADKDDISVNEICLSYLMDKGEISGESLRVFKPSVCNRLDRNTSGLIIFAKNYKAAALFSRALKDRLIHKYYLCMVKGRIDKEGEAGAYLVKDERTNRVSVSDKQKSDSSSVSIAYRPLKYNDDYSLLEVELITGKSHQIRAQMAHLDHPLLGDYKYGDRKLNDSLKERFDAGSQLLHSHKLVIPSGIDPDLEPYAGTYTAPVPKAVEDMVSGLFEEK